MSKLVSKKYIEKTLTEIILNKCKKPSYALNSLNNRIKHSFNEFRDKYATVDTSVEHSLTVLKNGEILKQSEGDRFSVKPKYEESAQALLEKIASDLTKPLDEAEWSTGEMREHFENELINRLNETNDGLFHIHNHPSSDPNNPIPTYLSDADCNNSFLNPIRYRSVNLFNTVKCQMAVSPNGTSMILINHNPVSTRRTVDEDKFRQTVRNLQSTMSDYRKGLVEKIRSRESNLIEQEIKKLPKTMSDERRRGLEDEIKNNVSKQVYKQIMDENKNNFPKVSNKVVKDFEDLGFELKFDFSDVILNE